MSSIMTQEEINDNNNTKDLKESGDNNESKKKQRRRRKKKTGVNADEKLNSVENNVDIEKLKKDENQQQGVAGKKDESPPSEKETDDGPMNVKTQLENNNCEIIPITSEKYSEWLKIICPNQSDETAVIRCDQYMTLLKKIQERIQSSSTAFKIYKAMDKLHDIMKLIAEGFSTEWKYDPVLDTNIIKKIVECIQLEASVLDLVPEIKGVLIPLVNRALQKLKRIKNKTSNNKTEEKEAKICYVYLMREECTNEVLTYIEECIKKFPKEVYFRVAKLSSLSYRGEFVTGVQEVKKMLTLFPEDPELLFKQIGFLKSVLNVSAVETLNACQQYLDVAVPDDRRAPDAYYTMSWQYYLMTDTKVGGRKKINKISKKELLQLRQGYILNMKQTFLKGLQAESLQLPLFLPYRVTLEKQLAQGMLADLHKNHSAMMQKHESQQQQQQQYFGSPPLTRVVMAPAETKRRKTMEAIVNDRHRIATIVKHRELIHHNRESTLKVEFIRGANPIPLICNSESYSSFGQYDVIVVGLREITFNDVDITQESSVFNGCIIRLLLIETTVAINGIAYQVVEDAHKNVMKLAISNLDKDSIQNLIYGCRIVLLNPVIKGHAEMNSEEAYIDISNPKCLVIQNSDEFVNSQCRFCQRLSSFSYTCRHCEYIRYCSTYCHELDMHINRHYLICNGNIITMQRNMNQQTTTTDTTTSTSPIPMEIDV